MDDQRAQRSRRLGLLGRNGRISQANLGGVRRTHPPPRKRGAKHRNFLVSWAKQRHPKRAAVPYHKGLSCSTYGNTARNLLADPSMLGSEPVWIFPPNQTPKATSVLTTKSTAEIGRHFGRIQPTGRFRGANTKQHGRIRAIKQPTWQKMVGSPCPSRAKLETGELTVGELRGHRPSDPMSPAPNARPSFGSFHIRLPSLLHAARCRSSRRSFDRKKASLVGADPGCAVRRSIQHTRSRKRSCGASRTRSRAHPLTASRRRSRKRRRWRLMS